MNFTRDPIVETIITPKEGFKLVIRSSKGGGQEEFIVDSVQVILIGNNCFYRSLEKPKAFVVPAHDYEILEVRETRMVMKLPQAEKGGIKIGGGREAPKASKEEESEPQEVAEGAPEGRDRRGKKRFRRGRRGERFEKEEVGSEEPVEHPVEGPQMPKEERVAHIIPPPSTLISETIARYKEMPGFAAAFYEKEQESVTLTEEQPAGEPEKDFFE